MIHDLPADKFEVSDYGADQVKIVCRFCKRAWTWPRTKELTVGRELHLLNHFAGHEAELVAGDGPEPAA